jgi:hypothetical protein
MEKSRAKSTVDDQLRERDNQFFEELYFILLSIFSHFYRSAVLITFRFLSYLFLTPAPFDFFLT